jgi:hypothetical protein
LLFCLSFPREICFSRTVLVAGAAASASLSNAYYPARERTLSNTATNWGLDVGIDAFTFVLKEFWPDVNQKLFHYEEPAQ